MKSHCDECRFALKSKIGVYGCDLFNGKRAHKNRKGICVRTYKSTAPLLREMFKGL